MRICCAPHGGQRRKARPSICGSRCARCARSWNAIRRDRRSSSTSPRSATASSQANYSTRRLTISNDRAIFNHMVDNRLDAVFHALADPTRRGMLAKLALGEKSVGELAEPFRMSFAGAAKHVKVLEGAGLVARRKAGRKQICTLQAERWLRQWEKFWNVRLDRLEAHVPELFPLPQPAFRLRQRFRLQRADLLP